MSRQIGGLLVASLLFSGCGSSGEDATADEQSPIEMSNTGRPAEPASLADVAPGDTAGILALMRTMVRDADAATASLVPRDTLLDSGPGLEQRQLRLWLLDGRPVKLVATEPNATDRIAPETITWFRLGVIAVVQPPAGMFLFAADGLIFTADESMMPVELAPELETAIERETLDSVKARLAVFGVGYP